MVNNPVGHQVVYTSIAFGIIDAVAVALRMLGRWRSNAAFAADDALIIASLVPLFAMVAVGYLSVEAGGLGLSTAVDMELGHGPSRVSILLKLLMASIITYTLAITLVKLSILVLYRRIFSTVVFGKSVLIVGAAVILWFVTALVTNLFQCRPFLAAFDPELLFTHHCIDLKAYYRGITASNLCIDVVMLYMPLHMVWGLQLRTQQKVALSGIFLLGGLACVAGALRIVTVGGLQKDDLTYSISKAYIWSQVEPSMAILCACLMTLRPLFADLNLTLNLSKLSNRFSRSKSLSIPKDTSASTDLSKEGSPHLRSPGLQASRPRTDSSSSSTSFSDEGTETKKGGLQIITVDLGATDRKESFDADSRP